MSKYSFPLNEEGFVMNLKSFFVILIFCLFFCGLNACDSFVFNDNEIVFITDDEFQKLENIYGCTEYWGCWKCRNHGLNGSSVKTCQNCYGKESAASGKNHYEG